MAAARADGEGPVDLGTSLRRAVASYVDEIVIFVLANTAWVLVVAAVVATWTLVPPLVVLAPVLALPTSALMRLAIACARDGVPTWRMVGDEIGRRPLAKLVVAAVQLVVTLLGLGNVTLSMAMGGLVGVLTGLVAIYAVALVSAYALVVWPMLSDPRRAETLGRMLRLATVVVVSRPLQLLVLLIVGVLAVVVSVQLIVPALILPSLVMLAVAWYVVPRVDRLAAPGG